MSRSYSPLPLEPEWLLEGQLYLLSPLTAGKNGLRKQ
jgi:hypothetical protein